MAPRTRRTITIEPVENDDPIDSVMAEDRAQVADQFSDALEQMRGFDSGNVKGILYKTERGGGKFLFVAEYYPPFEATEIFKELKERYNGGDFQLRIFVEGKIKKNVNFSIAAGPSTPVNVKDSSNDMMPMMITMMNASADRQMQMMMQMSQQSQAMFAAMNASQTQLMGVLIPAIAGGREKTSDIIGMVTALGGKKEGGMAETLEMLKGAKTLFGGGEGGGGLDLDDIVGSGLKLAGPVMAAVGRAVQQRREVRPDAGSYAEPVSVDIAPPPLLIAPVVPAHVLAMNPAQDSANPVLRLIRDDVLYFFSRHHSPELAAEAILDVLNAGGVTEEQVHELVATFAISPDWIGALAAEGIDLRADPEWAGQFLQELVNQHAAERDEPDDTGGESRREGDPEPDGEAGERRVG